jgi:acetyl esterase/lipase
MAALPDPGFAQTSREGQMFRRLKPDSTIGELLVHPAFDGFAPRLLPWDGREYDRQMKLADIGALLPYHTHVEPKTTVDALNRMVDDAADQRRVFYDIYAEAEKRLDPAKGHTGLFFFRGQPGAPFAIISPGGGFAYVGSVHEGFPYAVAISEAGLNAFVLKYRAGLGAAAATQDLAASISYVFSNAASLDVATSNYSLWGSSAGARMAAAIGSHGTERFGQQALPRPSAVIMAYTAHSDLGAVEPPTFAIVGDKDGISPPESMRHRVAALRRIGAEVDFREYPGLAHGFGPGVGTSAEGWVTEAVSFWQRHQSR